jgi:hypothetical protein
MFQGQLSEEYPLDVPGIHLVETCPEAVLRLSSRTVRYWFRRIPWCVAVVYPYGVDVHQPPLHFRFGHNVAVAWKDDPVYADKLLAWWHMN